MAATWLHTVQDGLSLSRRCHLSNTETFLHGRTISWRRKVGWNLRKAAEVVAEMDSKGQRVLQNLKQGVLPGTVCSPTILWTPYTLTIGIFSVGLGLILFESPSGKSIVLNALLLHCSKGWSP
jgi:hypothetical protein